MHYGDDDDTKGKKPSLPALREGRKPDEVSSEALYNGNIAG